MNPTISIIIPCYNQAKYLSECLHSVLDQTYTNWECLIINDGSPDDTENLAKEWCHKDKRIKYYYKANSGVCDTRNFGIKHAQGEFIMPLDADDKIAPPYIEKALKIFENTPNTKLIYCNTIFFGAKNYAKTDVEYSFKHLLYENIIHHAGIYRKSDFLKTQGYNLNMHDGLEDWDFWLTLINPEDKVVKLDGYYYYYRIKNISRSTLIDKAKNEELILQIFKNHLSVYHKYFNPIRDHNEALFYKATFQRIKSEKEYRLGTFFFFPINYIKRVLWRKKLKKENRQS